MFDVHESWTLRSQFTQGDRRVSSLSLASSECSTLHTCYGNNLRFHTRNSKTDPFSHVIMGVDLSLCFVAVIIFSIGIFSF